jgi:hypothetical protein
MSLPQLGKENPLAETAIKSLCDLTAIRESDSLSVAKLEEKASGTPFRGPFFFSRVCSWFVLRG